MEAKPEHDQEDQIIITKSQSESQQLDRWSQGCQAIFAGFVASAHLQNLRPSIRDFGKTPQLEMIRSTLGSIGECQRREGISSDDEVIGWMKTLDYVLRREDNMYTKAVIPRHDLIISPNCPDPALYLKAQIRPSQLVSNETKAGQTSISDLPSEALGDGQKEVKSEDVEWELTSRGKKIFNIRQDGRVAIPREGVPKWWNM